MSQVGLGYISTNTFNNQNTTYLLPMDESVCGMLFDLSGFNKPFEDFYAVRQFFGNGETQCINNMSEAENVGLWKNAFMNGVPYYHIKAFYDYVGKDTPLYIKFADCSNDFYAIEEMQTQAGGKLFQIGVWTAQSLWKTLNGSAMTFSDLCSKVETATELLTGKIGVTQESTHISPASTLLCANTYFTGDKRTLFDVPSGLMLNMPKLSVCLVQDGTDEVHTMQEKNPNYAPVGCLGILMACCCLAYAEESIGYVAKFNLNKNDQFDNAEVWFGDSAIRVGDLHYAKNYVANRGYIMPTEYDGKEAEVFFTGDPTFSKGDYFSLANNRIMHKVRRAVQSALLPYVNGNLEIDTTTGVLSVTANTILTQAVISMLDAVMINGSHQSQLSGRAVSFSSSYDILNTDQISMQLSIEPVNYSNVINEKDSVNI